MSYTPTEWKSGDVITSEKLNNLEQGVADASSGGGGGVLIVNDVSGTLDKTWKEIYDATTGGKLCLISVTNNGFDILALITIIATDHDTMYGVGADNKQYETSTEDGYPVLNG